jgi:rhodanese-related sulfurtransferase
MAVPRITKDALKERLDGDAAGHPIILDARLKYPYEHSTLVLPGAVRVDPDAPNTSGLSTDRDIVAYDSDPEELVSARVAAALIRQGYRASALEGGLGDWVTAKFPTDTKDAPKQAPPKAGGLG